MIVYAPLPYSVGRAFGLSIAIKELSGEAMPMIDAELESTQGVRQAAINAVIDAERITRESHGRRRYDPRRDTRLR